MYFFQDFFSSGSKVNKKSKKTIIWKNMYNVLNFLHFSETQKNEIIIL